MVLNHTMHIRAAAMAPVVRNTCRVQLLKVFFPDTSDLERRQLAAAVPPAVHPGRGIYEPFSFGELRAAFDAHLPPGKRAYRKVMWESVRQMLGALGFGDLLDMDARNAVFDLLDTDKDGKISYQDVVQWYLDMTDDHEVPVGLGAAGDDDACAV